MNTNVTKIFVLMLENRAFDHMLGFSGIKGTDAQTGQPTTINGLTGQESNSYENKPYPVTQPADFTMPVDPGHEFPDVVQQLGGLNATYPFGGAYPPIDNSGFVADYVDSKSPDEGKAPNNFGEIMKCYSPDQLPVLNALASNFAVCDNWFSSIPGPTWPNRFFLHAASSGGLDHSPTTPEILEWEGPDGFSFANGSIFDALNNNSSLSFPWKIYRGASSPKVGSIPSVSALKGITYFDTTPFESFVNDVNMPSYPWSYTFIEPNYGDVTDNSYAGGTSQHPMDNVTSGEGLIKEVYEAIRNSPHWEQSMLIVTWDEHGGFYDHVSPGQAVAPGDTAPGSTYNQYGFTFEQYGVRVPAVVVSPYIPENIIDHRIYDHASVPATIEQLFNMSPLTKRDAAANNVLSLLSLSEPRTNTPTSLPDPAVSPQAEAIQAPNPAVLNESLEQGNLPGFLVIALKNLMEIYPEAEHPYLLKEFQALQTRGDAAQYLEHAMTQIQTEAARRAQL